MGAGMELVLGKHAGQSQVVGRMSGDAAAFPECIIFINSVLFTSYFYSFHLVVVFVFSHSSIPVWLVISLLELT